MTFQLPNSPPGHAPAAQEQVWVWLVLLCLLWDSPRWVCCFRGPRLQVGVRVIGFGGRRGIAAHGPVPSAYWCQQDIVVLCGHGLERRNRKGHPSMRPSPLTPSGINAFSFAGVQWRKAKGFFTTSKTLSGSS